MVSLFQVRSFHFMVRSFHSLSVKLDVKRAFFFWLLAQRTRYTHAWVTPLCLLVAKRLVKSSDYIVQRYGTIWPCNEETGYRGRLHPDHPPSPTPPPPPLDHTSRHLTSIHPKLRGVSLVRAMHARGSSLCTAAPFFSDFFEERGGCTQASAGAAEPREARPAPSLTRMAICVSRVLLDGLQKKERPLTVYIHPGSSSSCLININYIKYVVIHSSYSGLLFLLKGNCFPSYSCYKLCVNELKTN